MAQNPADHNLPMLNLDETKDGESFGVYLQQLRNSVSREKKVYTGDLRNPYRLQRVLMRKRKNETTSNMLQFAPITYNGHKIDIIIYPVDLYIFGIKIERTCYILTTTPSSDVMIKVENCLVQHKFSIIYVNVDFSYPALEKAAGIKRSEIILGRAALVKGLEFFSKLTPEDGEVIDDLVSPIALHVLCFTQFFCEAVRIKVLAEIIIRNFVHGKVMGVLLIILEHGWAIASRRLLRLPESKSTLEVYYSDNADEPLTIEDLNELYDVLRYYKNSDLNKEDKAGESEMVMARMFLHTYLGKHIKSARVILATESHYDVEAVKHTFHDKNIVLQYNHRNTVEPSSTSLVEYLRATGDQDIPAESVLVNAHEDYFIELTEQPLKSLPEKSFTSFSKPSGRAQSGQFTNTLICQKEGEEEEKHELPNVELVVMNYVSKTGVGCNFDVRWEQLGTNEKEEKYNLGVKNLRDAVDEVSHFFDMFPCESFEPGANKRKERRERARGIQENAKEHSFALSGKFMGTTQILLEAKFEVGQVTMEVILTLKVRSEEMFGCKFIHKAVNDWLLR